MLDPHWACGACQLSLVMQREGFIAPRWKQALGSTIHCLRRDATGIIVTMG